MDGLSCKCGLKMFCFCALVPTVCSLWCCNLTGPELVWWDECWLWRGQPGTWDKKEFRKENGEKEFWASVPTIRQLMQKLRIFKIFIFLIVLSGLQQHYFDWEKFRAENISIVRYVSHHGRRGVPWTCYLCSMVVTTESLEENVECWCLAGVESQASGDQTWANVGSPFITYQCVTVPSPTTGNFQHYPCLSSTQHATINQLIPFDFSDISITLTCFNTFFSQKFFVHCHLQFAPAWRRLLQSNLS